MLDALDEALLDNTPARPSKLGEWIRQDLAVSKPRLCITCRSAEWPLDLTHYLARIYGEDRVVHAMLEPLAEADIRAIANYSNLDPHHFWRAVEASGTESLAGHALVLSFLLNHFTGDGTLPQRRANIFAEAIQQLAEEPSARTRDRTATNVPASQIIAAAEHMALLCLLTGKDGIETTPTPTPHALHSTQLEALSHIGHHFSAPIRTALARSGLCQMHGTTGFRFAHRQYAEYLAGRRIARLPFHQARALLSSNDPLAPGVAGPLRETASFAAEVAARGDLAEWLIEADPEVIGMARIDDCTIRRRAVRRLFELFERHELVDVQARRETFPLDGLHYPEASEDLRPVLAHRSGDKEDLIEFAIQLVRAWKLPDLSDALADLVLDRNGPYSCRKSAGYVLADFGTVEARRRLLSLTGDNDETDPQRDLKGLALRCNWPHHLSTPELIGCLTVPADRNYHGAYDGFLYTLDQAGFSAADAREAGLEWAKHMVEASCTFSLIPRLVGRIARAAVDALPDPTVATGLAKLLLASAHRMGPSPLDDSHRSVATPATRATHDGSLSACNSTQRQALISALCSLEYNDDGLWLIARTTHNLIADEDFPWLLEQAQSPDASLATRTNFAILANACDWSTDPDLVAEAYRVKDIEPLASHLRFPVSTDLRSQRAADLRAAHAASRRQRLASRPSPRPEPPRRESRLLEHLQRVESGQIAAFLDLLLELDPNARGCPVWLTATPAWLTAGDSLRNRIIVAARQFAATPSAEAARALASPLNQIFDRSLAALLLLVQQDDAWLENQPASWWTAWSGYILREIRPGLSAESGERPLKQRLVLLLHARAANSVREQLKQLMHQTDPDAPRSFGDLLDLLAGTADAELDRDLCFAIGDGTLPTDRRRVIAHAALQRVPALAISACISALAAAAASSDTETCRHLAAVLLLAQPAQGWPPVRDILRRFQQLAEPVLTQLAHDYGRWEAGRDQDNQSPFAQLPEGQLLEILEALFELTPPSPAADVPPSGYVTPRYSVKHFRDHLLNSLSARNTSAAINALRRLEGRFATQHPWLRRARAIATREYQLTAFGPARIDAIAEVLHSNSTSTRLIRSEDDVLDGIVEALESHSRSLRQEGSSELDDYWNTPRGAEPTRKSEERASDKLRNIINMYFQNHLVSLSREPQVYRRQSSPAQRGAPSSRVDILVQVPADGTAKGQALTIPIEVKFSDNDEAVSCFKDQLVDRYMNELGTRLGVFVVLWLGPSSSGRSLASLRWESRAAAETALKAKAAEITALADPFLHLRTVVIDVSLPQAQA